MVTPGGNTGLIQVCPQGLVPRPAVSWSSAGGPVRKWQGRTDLPGQLSDHMTPKLPFSLPSPPHPRKVTRCDFHPVQPTCLQSLRMQQELMPPAGQCPLLRKVESSPMNQEPSQVPSSPFHR